MHIPTTRFVTSLVFYQVLVYFMHTQVLAVPSAIAQAPKVKHLNQNAYKIVRRQSMKQKNKQASRVKSEDELIASIAKLQSLGLSRMKFKLENRVKAAQDKVNRSKNLSLKEKEFKLHVLEMFLEELHETERDMLNAEQALKKSLTLDFWNTSTLKKNSWERLEALRLATLKEEKSYKRMLDFEIKMKKFALVSNSSSWMDEIINEVSHAADQLEDLVAEHELSQKEIKDVDGTNIEAVFHVKEGIGESLENGKFKKAPDDSEDYKLDLLIDANDNKYILAKLKDPTSPHIDHILVIDIIMVLLVAVPLGYLCQLLGLPALFGYVLSGVILGPSGLNWIQEMVQIESLGELGVFMIMFSTGLEFSFEKIRKVWKIAIQTSCIISIVMVFFGVVIGAIIHAPINECAFVSISLSLSSTPLVTKFLQSSSKAEVSTSDYSSILMAVLVVQDVLLSFFIALLPGLGGHANGIASYGSSATYVFYLISHTTLSLVLIVLITSFLTVYVIPLYSRHITHQTREMQLLGALAIMYLSQLFTNYLGISMELGCFAAGVMLAYSSHLAALEEKVFPLHDFLSVIFFASIGFHVFPSFVMSEVSLLLTLTAVVTAGKFMICLIVLGCVLPPQSRKLKWIITSGLAQVSEFSFVLGSRARHFEIITREVYFVILSVTTLSLTLAPLLWKLSLWRYRLRHVVEHIS